MAIHSSILAQKIPWTGSLVGFSPRGRKESGTTKHTVYLNEVDKSSFLYLMFCKPV